MDGITLLLTGIMALQVGWHIGSSIVIGEYTAAFLLGITWIVFVAVVVL